MDRPTDLPVVMAIFASLLAIISGSSRYDDAVLFFAVALANSLATLRLAVVTAPSDLQLLEDVSFGFLDLFSVVEPVVDGTTLLVAKDPLVFGSLVGAVGSVASYILAGRSYFLSMVSYVLTLMVLNESDVFLNHTSRTICVMVMVLLSMRSRHVRMANLGGISFVIAQTYYYDHRHLNTHDISVAMAMSIPLCVVYDILVRSNVIKSLSSIARVASVVIAILNTYEVLQVIGCNRATDRPNPTTASPDVVRQQENVLDNINDPMSNCLECESWNQILNCTDAYECLSSAMPYGPSMLCSFFSVVTLLHVVHTLGRLQVSIVANVAVVCCLVGLFSTDSRHIVFTPIFLAPTSMLVALTMQRLLVTHNAAPEYHTLVYGRGRHQERETGTSNNNRATAAAKKPTKTLATPSAPQPKTSTHPPNLRTTASGKRIPTEEDLEKAWKVVDIKMDKAEKAREQYNLYKKLAFQFEAVARGTIAYNDETRLAEKQAQEKAESFAEKTRRAARVWAAKEEEAKAAERQARSLEALVMEVTGRSY